MFCTVLIGFLMIMKHMRTHVHTHRTLWEVTHPADHNALYTALAHLVLIKSGKCCKKVMCRIRTADGKDWLRVQAVFRYGLLGIGCSMRV
jgi:formate-dependent nitrite reductase membrane component NrfD